MGTYNPKGKDSYFVRTKLYAQDKMTKPLQAVGRGLDKLTGKSNKTSKSIFSLGNAFGILSIAVAARQFKRNIVGRFAAQERSINSLAQALRNLGLASERELIPAVDALREHAALLQDTTLAADEAILEGTATIAQLAGVSDIAQLKQLQEALVGIAHVFFRGEMVQAGTQIGKSLGSTINTLSRYGFTVDTTATQQEKINQLLEQSGGLMKIAEAAADDLQGQWIQLGNSIGDIGETFGRFLITVTDMRSSVDTLRATMVDPFHEKLLGEEPNKKIKATIKFLQFLKGGLKRFYVTLEWLTKSGKILFDSFFIAIGEKLEWLIHKIITLSRATEAGIISVITGGAVDNVNKVLAEQEAKWNKMVEFRDNQRDDLERLKNELQELEQDMVVLSNQSYNDNQMLYRHKQFLLDMSQMRRDHSKEIQEIREKYVHDELDMLERITKAHEKQAISTLR